MTRPKPAVEKLLTADELADVLQLPIQTVRMWSHRGVGPQAVRVGRFLRYKPSDVNQWIDSQKKTNRQEAS